MNCLAGKQKNHLERGYSFFMPFKDKEKDKEYHKKYGADYYQKNKDKWRLLSKNWRKNNLERAREYVRKYYDKNRAKISELNRLFRQRNKLKISIYRKKRYYSDDGGLALYFKRKYLNKKIRIISYY